MQAAAGCGTRAIFGGARVCLSDVKDLLDVDGGAHEAGVLSVDGAAQMFCFLCDV